jgi:hypothetical protein
MQTRSFLSSISNSLEVHNDSVVAPTDLTGVVMTHDSSKDIPSTSAAAISSPSNTVALSSITASLSSNISSSLCDEVDLMNSNSHPEEVSLVNGDSDAIPTSLTDFSLGKKDPERRMQGQTFGSILKFLRIASIRIGLIAPCAIVKCFIPLQ